MTRGDDPELDRMLRAVADELRQRAPLRTDLTDWVMVQIRRPASVSVFRWLVQARPVPLSPLTGLIAVAASVAILLLARPARAPRSEPTPRTPIRLVLFAPRAAAVTVVGDFNDWDPRSTPLHPSRTRAGLWTVDVPLAPGRHEYAFLVDGTRWLNDPTAAREAADEFGTPNSVLTVVGS